MKRKKTAPPSDQHKRTVLDPLKLNLSPTPPDIHFGPPPSDEKRKAAIFVVHGMGQQIPLETLDESARRLLSVSGAPETTDIRSRTVQAGKKRFQRVEFDLCDASQQVIEVHLYEGYWAPITEGKVTLRDVIGFLWYAGTSGLLKREKTFCRWLFGGLADFPIPSNSRRNIFLAFLTLLAMGIIGALISLIAAANLFSVSLAYRWPSADLLQTLTIILRIFIGCLAIFVVPLSLVYFFKTQLQTCWFWKPLNTLLWWLFFLELGITILVGGLMFSYSLYDFFHVLPAPLVPTGQSAMPPGWKWWLVWGGLFWGLVYIRSFLIQYLGDVAAYVASHRLDRFRKIRTRIRNTVYDVLYAIYAQNDDQGRPVYHHVGLMGHSLDPSLPTSPSTPS